MMSYLSILSVINSFGYEIALVFNHIKILHCIGSTHKQGMFALNTYAPMVFFPSILFKYRQFLE